jgi:glycosidase
MQLHHLTIRIAISLLAFSAPVPDASARADTAIWNRQIIYLLIPDRFYNGDPNNDKSGGADCFDPGSARKFHGGDLAGVQQKLDYVQALGVTAIWITPLYKQVPVVKDISGSENGACDYHGYWPDFTDPSRVAIEPKLGTVAAFATLLADVHTRKMKFIIDMVVNHAGYGPTLLDNTRTGFIELIRAET